MSREYICTHIQRLYIYFSLNQELLYKYVKIRIYCRFLTRVRESKRLFSIFGTKPTTRNNKKIVKIQNRYLDNKFKKINYSKLKYTIYIHPPQKKILKIISNYFTNLDQCLVLRTTR